MSRGRRLSGYGLVLLALLASLAAGPRAWATPEQAYRPQNMTVPTATPVVEWSPTARPPTDEPPARTPEATSPPGPPTTPAATLAPPPASISTVAVQPAPGAVLLLTKEVGRREVWPGATVGYTLTLTNAGSSSAHQVTLEDTLPAGLLPGAAQGAGATWFGRTLQAQVPILPPGGRLVVAFDAVVAAGVAPGGLLLNQARATAAGGLSASALVAVALPPAELPVVGAAPGMPGAGQ